MSSSPPFSPPPSSLAPRIVAIETSGRQGSVAVAVDGTLLRQEAFASGFRHAAELMPAIRTLTEAQGWTPGDIQQVYLSTGPGSFTGLRIAIAVARSLHLATGCALVAVPTLDVIARNAPAESRNIVAVLDAKRGQVFAARYLRGADDSLIRTAEPALVDPTAFLRATPRPVTILGEGVDYHRPALQAGVDSPEELLELDKTLWPGTAAHVHALGWELAQRGEFADPTTLLPVYIRLPEAEEVWRKRHGGVGN